MEKPIIRPADQQDADALIAFGGEYTRFLYRGFFPEELLKKAEEDYVGPEVLQWLADQRYCVDVLDRTGNVCGLIAYGADHESENCGFIRIFACDASCEEQDHRALIQHSLCRMKDMGFRQVHLWLLKDNFRIRFLFESIGFRTDGEHRIRQQAGQELLLTRYIYQMAS